MKDKTTAVKKLGVLAKEKNVWMCVISVLILFLMLFPILWMLNTSLKTETEIFQYPPTFYPHEMYRVKQKVYRGDFEHRASCIKTCEQAF